MPIVKWFLCIPILVTRQKQLMPSYPMVIGIGTEDHWQVLTRNGIKGKSLAAILLARGE
jgi:hypothetical protein